MTRIEIIEKLRPFFPHLDVDEDCWYSCPKSGKNCDDRRDPNQCDCGGDSRLEQCATAVEEMLKEKESAEGMRERAARECDGAAKGIQDVIDLCGAEFVRVGDPEQEEDLRVIKGGFESLAKVIRALPLTEEEG